MKTLTQKSYGDLVPELVKTSGIPFSSRLPTHCRTWSLRGLWYGSK